MGTANISEITMATGPMSVKHHKMGCHGLLKPINIDTVHTIIGNGPMPLMLRMIAGGLCRCASYEGNIAIDENITE